MAVAQILCLAVLCLCLPTPSIASLTAFNCSSTSKMDQRPDFYITNLLQDCNTISDVGVHVVQVYRHAEKPIVFGYRCKVTFTQTLVNADSSRLVSNSTTETLTRSTCLEAHRTKSITLAGNRIPYLDVDGTVNHTLKINEGSYQPGFNDRQYHLVKTYEITLSRYFGTVDLQSDIVRFDNGLACDNIGAGCQDDQLGQIFWIWSNSTDRAVIFQGPAGIARARFAFSPNVYYVVIHDMDEVFALKVYETIPDAVGSDRRERIFRSADIPDLYILLNSNRVAVGKGAGYLGWHLEKGSNSTYSEPHFGRSIPTTTIAKRCCDRERQHQFRHLKSLPVNATTFFPENGLVGVKKNVTFNIEKCNKTTVTMRKTDECFRYISVKDEQNMDRFLDPESRVLLDQAEPIPCSTQDDQAEPQTLDEAVQSVEDSPGESYREPIENIGSSEAHTLETKVPTSVDWVKILAVIVLCSWVCIALVRVIRIGVKRRISRAEEAGYPPVYSINTLKKILEPPYF